MKVHATDYKLIITQFNLLISQMFSMSIPEGFYCNSLNYKLCSSIPYNFHCTKLHLVVCFYTFILGFKLKKLIK